MSIRRAKKVVLLWMYGNKELSLGDDEDAKII